jgi:hypothetical protein
MATKPSPYTFINDLDNVTTANVISIDTNVDNSKTLIANYNDPPLYENPQLQIINDPGGSNGQIQFNNGRGFAGDSNLTYNSTTARLNLRGNLYITGNLFANIQTNLNNFHLSGGANGYVLTTDGAGNVRWISPDPNTTASLYNGNSNVIVYANGNIAFSSNGVANVVTISNNGINLGSNANVRITGGNATNYLTTDGNGNLYWADDVPIYIGNSAPNLPQGHLWFDNDEGRAYINYDGNSWVDLSPAVMPNPDMYANTITFPDGSVQTTAGGGGPGNYGNSNVAAYLPTYIGNVGASNVNVSNTTYTFNLSATGLASLTTVSASGNVTGAQFIGSGNNLSNIQGANVTGAVSSATYATTAGAVTTGAQPNITSLGTLTSLSVSGNINTSANIHALYFKGNGSQLTGISVATAGTVTTNAQPNITSVGTLANLSVTGNTRTGNLIVTANTESIGPSTGSIQTAGGIGAQGNIVGNHHLYVGPGSSLTAFTNPVMIGKNSGEEYIQSAIINSSETGSSDWVAYGDNGTESGGWSDFGFTSSNFSDPAYTVTGSNDGYFFVQPQSGSYGGNLVLATGNQGTTNDIIFATGGFQTGNIFGRISHSNLTLEIPTGNISIGGNITANNLGNISSIDVDGNTSNILYGNGIFAAAPSTTYGNSNVATFLGDYGSNTISTTGNITAGNFVGNGAGLTNVTVSVAGNIVGTQSNVTLVAGSYSTVFDNTGVATFPGNVTTTGAFVGNGAALTNVAVRTTGSWTVATGTNTYSITVPVNGTYQLWVRGNIPNGILVYQATVSVTNTNVPALGTQRAWNYTAAGSPISLTTMPTQIVGVDGTISTATVVTTTANVFDFVISNTSGSPQTIFWGYVTL